MAAQDVEAVQEPVSAAGRGPSGPAEAPPMRRRFTVDEYFRMAEVGILRPEERVELVDGEVFCMSPIGSRHAAGVRRTRQLLSARIGDRALLDTQNPIRLGNHAEPEPDVVVLVTRDDLYAERHPEPADVLLAVEVADTSLAYDREVKLPSYARAGVRETWLEDLNGDAVEAYRRPGHQGYGEVRRYRRGDRIAPEAFPDVEIAVEHLLGQPARGRPKAQR